MAKKDNSERINKDITEFSNWKKSVSRQGNVRFLSTILTRITSL